MYVWLAMESAILFAGEKLAFIKVGVESDYSGTLTLCFYALFFFARVFANMRPFDWLANCFKYMPEPEVFFLWLNDSASEAFVFFDLEADPPEGPFGKVIL